MDCGYGEFVGHNLIFQGIDFLKVHNLKGDCGNTVVRCCVTNRKVAGSIPSLEFFIHIKSFRSHKGLGVDSASNGNEYQEHFLGVKAAGA